MLFRSTRHSKVEEVQSSPNNRPVRDRNAPDRFTVSAYPTKTRVARVGRSTRPADRRKAKEEQAKHAKVERKLRKIARDVAKAEREEDFVDNYKFDHVGKAFREVSPDVWVEVPVPNMKWLVSEKISAQIWDGDAESQSLLSFTEVTS